MSDKKIEGDHKRLKQEFARASLKRQAEVVPESFDAQTNSIEVFFSSETPYKRFGFFEDFVEILSHDEGAVRLDRLNNGAPFLNNHKSEDLLDGIGVCEFAEIRESRGFARITLTDREDARPIIQDIRNGILRNISVGYAIHDFIQERDEAGNLIVTVTDWEPMELSAVLIPADASAQFRKVEQKKDCDMIDETKKVIEEKPKKVENEKALNETQNTGDKTMSEIEQKVEAIDLDKVRKEEKERAKGIRDAVRKCGLEESLADEMIDSDISLDGARSKVIEMIAEKQKESATTAMNPKVEIKRDEVDTAREGMKNALLNRINGSRYKIDEKGAEYRYCSLLDLAKESLAVRNIKVRGMTKAEIAKQALASRAYHGTSDFPELLANTFNKVLLDAFEATPQTFMPITRMVPAADFKEMSRVQLGGGSSLSKVLPNGEITRGSHGERAEKYSLETYANIVAITRQAIINDDMNAFSTVPETMGARARDLESDLAWGVITANAAMSDGNALFSVAHGNLGTAGSISATTLNELRSLGRQQVDEDGNLINLQLRWLIVPSALETTGEQFVSLIAPQEASKINPFGPTGRTPLELIVEPRLDADSITRWYAAGELGRVPMLEMARLEGEEGPAIETRDGFDVEGMEIKVRHDVAAKAIAWQGLYANNGV